jgi:O-antigen ligase
LNFAALRILNLNKWPFNPAYIFVGLVGLGYAAAIIMLSPLVSAALVLGSVFFVLALRYPVLSLYLMILSVPGQDLTSVTLGTSRLTLTQIAVILSLVVWLTNSIIYRKPLVPRPTPILLPFFLILIGVMVVSLLVATSTSDSLAEISRWLITFLTYLMATSLIQTRRQFWWLVVALMAGVVAEGVLGILQTQFSIYSASIEVSTQFGRAVGTFILPNPYGAYLEHGLPLILAVWLMWLKIRNQAVREWLKSKFPARGQNRRELIRAYSVLVGLGIGLLAGLLGILNSQSIGAWLGSVAALAVMIAVRGRKSVKLVLIIALVGTLGYLAVQAEIIPPKTFERLLSHTQELLPFDVTGVTVTPDNYPVVERMAMWQAGGNMFLSDPWLGVGIGNFTAVYNKFNMPQWIFSRGHAHNYYINISAECGLLGLCAYLALMFTAWAHAWGTVRRTCDLKLRYVAWGSLGILSAVMAHNLVENLHVLNMGIQWSAVLALFYSIKKLDQASS